MEGHEEHEQEKVEDKEQKEHGAKGEELCVPVYAKASFGYDM
jgi:hypothetical protein